MKWLKGIFGTSAEAVKPQAKEGTLTVEVGMSNGDNGTFQQLPPNIAIDKSILYAVGSDNINVSNATKSDSAQPLAPVSALASVSASRALASVSASRAQTPALDPALAQPRDQDPTLLESAPPSLALAQTPPPVLASDPAPAPAPAPALAPDPVSIIDPIINLVESIFNNEDPLKKYFFSIFIPPANSEDIKEKSIASTHSPAPTITPAQETELRETLRKCANACIYDTDLTPSDSSDPQSGSTKTTSTSSPTLKEKAEPPVYFGVGIKTTLEDIEDQKFLKITDIFEKSNLDKSNKDKFITHLNCKLGNDTEAHEYSITDIFNKFKDDNSATAQEKFDEKIDQIFRDLKESSIKFKISTDISQADPATKPADVTVDKIIFEKTNGVYQQKKMTPSTITELRDKQKTTEGTRGAQGVAV